MDNVTTPTLTKLSFDVHPELVSDSPDALEIVMECQEICKLLLTKNRAYASSYRVPLGIFSKLSNVDAINARIDDKLARIKQAKDFSEDTELDLIGYLILKRIAIQAGQPLKAALPEVCGFDPGFGKPCNQRKGHKGVHNIFDESKEPLLRPSVEDVRAVRDSVGKVYTVHPPAATPDTP